ncbi:ankyrin repeat-containing domain protein [Cladorrhinum sp. PSN259]|nr:ankyrin repeat-containing domain protein [Cladorrhinum sp. PSN259]
MSKSILLILSLRRLKMSTLEQTPYDFLQGYLAQKRTEYLVLFTRWSNGSTNTYDWPPWHWIDKSALAILPHELLLMICDYLYQSDLLHLALTCSALADFTIPLLYKRDITQFDCLSLRWACTFGIIDTLERALSYGASVDHRFDHGSALGCSWVDRGYTYSYLCDTPLKIAIRWNEVGVVRFLSLRVANLNMHDTLCIRFYHYCPIHWAIGIHGVSFGRSFEPGNPQVLRCLLEAGADPNQIAACDQVRFGGTIGEATPLALAMHNRVPIETVKLLLQAGAMPFTPNLISPNECSRNDRGPQRLLSYFQSDTRPRSLDENKIDLLIARTDPVDLVHLFRKWLVVLSWAHSFSMCQQYAKVTSIFIKHGVDLVSCAELGVSPIVTILHSASIWAHRLLGRRLVKVDKVASLMTLIVDVITDMCKATIIGAGDDPRQGMQSAIIDAVNWNLDSDNGGHDGRENTALQTVCVPFGFPGRASLIPLLLWYGASVNRIDLYGAGPLHRAAMFGPDDRVRPLLEFPGGLWSSIVDVNAPDNRGWTPLHYACLFGIRSKLGEQVATSKLLIDHGADVHARTDDGWTCLEFAFRCGNDDLVNLLLDRGARPEERTKPPEWEETAASRDIIWFCECIEDFAPYVVSKLVAHYRRASTAAYARWALEEGLTDEHMVRRQNHISGCPECADGTFDAPVYPFGAFRGVSPTADIIDYGEGGRWDSSTETTL